MNYCCSSDITTIMNEEKLSAYEKLIEQKKVELALLDNATTRMIYSFLCGRDSLRGVVSCMIADEPPLAAVAGIIEEICAREDSCLDLKNDTDDDIKDMIEELLSMVLKDVGFVPKVTDGHTCFGVIENGHYFRKGMLYEAAEKR